MACAPTASPTFSEHLALKINHRPPGAVADRDGTAPNTSALLRGAVMAKRSASRSRGRRNTAIAQGAIANAGLSRQIEVVRADAALTDHYQGMAPAEVVLICGLFGNIADTDIQRTIAVCPQLCAPDATVVWTRHRKAPDRVPLICDAFTENAFELQWLSERDAGYGVGVHRFRGTACALAAGVRMFSFVGYDALRQST